MKMNKWLAVLLTVLFLAPFCPARAAKNTAAFRIEKNTVLKGMDRSVLQGYDASVSGSRWTLVLPVRTDAAAGTVTAELVMPDKSLTPFKAQDMTMKPKEEGKGILGVRFSLLLLPDRKNADYSCTIRLRGKDKKGKTISANIPWTIRFRGAKESVEKARIGISGVKADLNVGEEGSVQVTLTNPCAATIIEDLELKISDAAGHILPRDTERLTVGKLDIGRSVTVTYPVTVLEKASVAPHVLKLDLSWTALGTAVTYSENQTVSIRQEIRLEQGGLKMAPSVTAGDSVAMTLPIMNMGRADVVNVLATVTMPGITERQSVLVGTIQPGETKQAQLVISTAKDLSGDFAGSVTVECTDQDGNPASLCVPASLRVERPVKKEAADTAGRETAATKKQDILVPALAGGCGLLLLMLLTQSIVLRRKLHLLEEEKL